MNRSLGENAIRTSGNANEFIGDFDSRWDEIAGGTDTAVLSIGELPGSIDKFTLIWHQNGRIYFRGEGFLTQDGNLLVGHYTN